MACSIVFGRSGGDRGVGCLALIIATCAALASSIYPVLIAPEKQSDKARAQTTGLKRAGMWDTVDRKAKS